MSFKEVTALRKAGRLDEAIEMAQADLDFQRNSWTIKAMFWCLNDKSKIVTGDELESTVEAMHSLAEELDESDEYVNKALQSVDSKLIPHRDEVFRAVELAKQAGQEGAACAILDELYDKGQLDKSFFPNYGWTIYRALHADRSQDVHRRKSWLMRYLQLDLERPSLLHSIILGEAVNIERTTPLQFLFSGFLNMWGIENLRDEDWEGMDTEDHHHIPSLVEKVISVYTKEMAITPQLTPSDEFNSVLDKALEVFPGNDDLPRYKAQLLIKAGNGEDAIEFYKKIIIRRPNKQYLWSELAGLVADKNLAISLLCNALAQNIKDEFAGKMRLHLASLLCDIGNTSQALDELEKVRSTYEQNQWRVPGEYYTIKNRVGNVQPSGDTFFYRNNCLSGQNFVYGELPTVIMVKAGEKKDIRPNGKQVFKWILWGENGTRITINPLQFSLPRRTNDGDLYEVAMREKRPVKVSKTNREAPAWVKHVKGNLQVRSNRDGKIYGKVDDNYIPEFLLNDAKDGDTVHLTLIKDGDKWKCASLHPAKRN